MQIIYAVRIFSTYSSPLTSANANLVLFGTYMYQINALAIILESFLTRRSEQQLLLQINFIDFIMEYEIGTTVPKK